MSTEDGSLFVGPHDGKELPNPIGGRMVVKVRDEDTAGAYSIHDNSIPPGSPGPRPHIHRHHEEAFYVLEGELTVRVGPQNSTNYSWPSLQLLRQATGSGIMIVV